MVYLVISLIIDFKGNLGLIFNLWIVVGYFILKL